MASPLDRMLAAKVYACEKWPYFASGVHAISLIETPHLTSGDKATLACDRWWRVYYNPLITELYPIAVLSGMILHELGHLIRNHSGRAEQFADVDRTRWNVAGDCAINPDLMEGPNPPTPVPEWGAMPDKYGMPPNLAAETYYLQLEDKLPPEPIYVNCGSCATGKTADYEADPPSGSAQDLGITAGEAELIRRQIAMEIHKQLEGTDRGSVPAGLQRWANDFMKPHVNYMAWMRAMLRNSYDVARGKGDYSFARPSRRQQLFGGRVIMPGTYHPKFRCGAIIDTSGSMSNKQLSQCIAEIRGFLMQIQNGADLFVASCDAKVGKIVPVQNIKQIELVGGGGTDMCAAFEAFEKMRPQMDMLLCLTDCITPWPAVAPRPVTAIIQVGSGALPPWPCKYIAIPVEEAEAAA